ncbi:MAG: hypothetical protein WC632_02520 [Candidatus Margulisiibacteriota bacterium]
MTDGICKVTYTNGTSKNVPVKDQEACNNIYTKSGVSTTDFYETSAPASPKATNGGTATPATASPQATRPTAYQFDPAVRSGPYSGSIGKWLTAFSISPKAIFIIKVGNDIYAIRIEGGKAVLYKKNAQGQFEVSNEKIQDVLEKAIGKDNPPNVLSAIMVQLMELAKNGGLNEKSIDLTALVNRVKAGAGDKPNQATIDKKAKEIVAVNSLNPDLASLSADLDKLSADAGKANTPFDVKAPLEQRKAALDDRKKIVNGRPADKAESVATAGDSQGLNVRLSSLEARYRDAYGGKELPKEIQDKINGVRINIDETQKKVDAEDKFLSASVRKQTAKTAAEDNLRALIDRLEGKGVFNTDDQAILDGLRNKNNPNLEILKASLHPNERIISFSQNGRANYLVVEKGKDDQWHILTPGYNACYIEQRDDGEPLNIKETRRLSTPLGSVDWLVKDSIRTAVIVVEPSQAERKPREFKNDSERQAWKILSNLGVTNYEAFHAVWKDEKIDREEAARLGIGATYHSFIDRNSDPNRVSEGDGYVDLAELNMALDVVKTYAAWGKAEGQTPTDEDIKKAAESFKTARGYQVIAKDTLEEIENKGVRKNVAGIKGLDLKDARKKLEEKYKENPALIEHLLENWEKLKNNENVEAEIAHRAIQFLLASYTGDTQQIFGVDPKVLARVDRFNPRTFNAENANEWLETGKLEDGGVGGGGTDDAEGVRKAFSDNLSKNRLTQATNAANKMPKARGLTVDDKDRALGEIVGKYLEQKNPDAAFKVAEGITNTQGKTEMFKKIFEHNKNNNSDYKRALDAAKQIADPEEKKKALAQLAHHIYTNREKEGDNGLIMDALAAIRATNPETSDAQIFFPWGNEGTPSLRKVREMIEPRVWVREEIAAIESKLLKPINDEELKRASPSELIVMVQNYDHPDAQTKLDKLNELTRNEQLPPQQKAYAYLVRGRLLYALAKSNATLPGGFTKQQLYREAAWHFRQAFELAKSAPPDGMFTAQRQTELKQDAVNALSYALADIKHGGKGRGFDSDNFAKEIADYLPTVKETDPDNFQITYFSGSSKSWASYTIYQARHSNPGYDATAGSYTTYNDASKPTGKDHLKLAQQSFKSSGAVAGSPPATPQAPVASANKNNTPPVTPSKKDPVADNDAF